MTTRVAFGKPLVEQGTIREDLAESRLEIEQARLLVLKAAHLMDTVGNKVSRGDFPRWERREPQALLSAPPSPQVKVLLFMHWEGEGVLLRGTVASGMRSPGTCGKPPEGASCHCVVLSPCI